MAAHWNRNDRHCAELTASLAAYGLGLKPSELLAQGRGAIEIARGRQVAMYLSHVSFGMSLARVAAAFGRDRSTVAHACHLVENRRDEDAFDAWLAQLESGIEAVASLRETAA